MFLQGQQHSGGAGRGEDGDKKDKKKKYEPPVPTRVGKKKKRSKGPDSANKLPAGDNFPQYLRGWTIELYPIWVLTEDKHV